MELVLELVTRWCVNDWYDRLCYLNYGRVNAKHGRRIHLVHPIQTKNRDVFKHLLAMYTSNRCKTMSPVEKVQCIKSWFIPHRWAGDYDLNALRGVSKYYKQIIDEELGFIKEVMRDFHSFLLKPDQQKRIQFTDQDLCDQRPMYKKQNKRQKTLYA